MKLYKQIRDDKFNEAYQKYVLKMEIPSVLSDSKNIYLSIDTYSLYFTSLYFTMDYSVGIQISKIRHLTISETEEKNERSSS